MTTNQGKRRQNHRYQAGPIVEWLLEQWWAGDRRSDRLRMRLTKLWYDYLHPAAEQRDWSIQRGQQESGAGMNGQSQQADQGREEAGR